MTLNLSTYRDILTSHAQATGWFGQVLKHEPISAPGSGLTAAFWVSRLGPVPTGSGLASTSGRLELMGTLLEPADTEPADGVDVDIVGAADALLTEYSGDFELGGNVRMVDLLGAYGTPLQVVFGYTRFAGGTTYRAATLTIPLILNDVWGQSA